MHKIMGHRIGCVSFDGFRRNKISVCSANVSLSSMNSPQPGGSAQWIGPRVQGEAPEPISTVPPCPGSHSKLGNQVPGSKAMQPRLAAFSVGRNRSTMPQDALWEVGQAQERPNGKLRCRDSTSVARGLTTGHSVIHHIACLHGSRDQ